MFDSMTLQFNPFKPVEFSIEEVRDNLEQPANERVLVEFRRRIEKIEVSFECFITLLKFNILFAKKNEMLLQFDDFTLTCSSMTKAKTIGLPRRRTLSIVATAHVVSLPLSESKGSAR